MFILENEKFCIFPIYYNEMLNEKDFVFKSRAITDKTILEIINQINIANKKGKILAIDLQFMTAYSTRTNAQKGLFEPLKEYLAINDFFFFNAQNDPSIIDLIISDLDINISSKLINYYDILDKKLIRQTDENINLAAIILCKHSLYQKINENDVLKQLWKIYLNHVAKALKDHCIDSKTQYLPSSDIYSNKYIRIKDLFLRTSDTSWCVYLLSKLIKERFKNYHIDGLVSMSNTGAMLANMVGIMLDKNVLFCTNVGPKFALDIKRIQKKIKRDANYVYIFDFLCLGTEIKNMKSILLAGDANIVGGVGISSLPDLDILRTFPSNKMESQSELTRAYSLVVLKDFNINYHIATSVLELEANKYVSSAN